MNPPPVIEPAQRHRASLQPALWLALLLALIAGVKLAVLWNLPTPFCPLRTMTNIPCPFCGSTRVLLAFAQFDPVAAFRFNPLFALVCIGVVAVFVVWLAGRVLHRDWIEQAQACLHRLPVWTALGIALAANWIYLYFALPH